MWRSFKSLVKMGLVNFVIICALAGYFLAFEIGTDFSFYHLVQFLLGLILITMGSFAFNQWQEVELDRSMARTQNRPLANNQFSKNFVFIFSWTAMLLGEVFLYFSNPLLAYLGAFTILLYNFLYTKWWKPKMAFAAVPGAIPGAMPVVMGVVAGGGELFGAESIFGFLIMFLWQMPHFWSLAIRFKEDYKGGNVPVLPAIIGNEKTILHMGIYTVVYIAVALLSPLFVQIWYLYFLLVIPFSIKVVWEYSKFASQKGEKFWLSFFLWTNFSMLAYLIVPVADKWLYFWIKT